MTMIRESNHVRVTTQTKFLNYMLVTFTDGYRLHLSTQERGGEFHGDSIRSGYLGAKMATKAEALRRLRQNIHAKVEAGVVHALDSEQTA